MSILVGLCIMSVSMRSPIEAMANRKPVCLGVVLAAHLGTTRNPRIQRMSEKQGDPNVDP